MSGRHRPPSPPAMGEVAGHRWRTLSKAAGRPSPRQWPARWPRSRATGERNREQDTWCNDSPQPGFDTNMTWAFRMPVGEIDTAGQCGRASAVQQPEVRIHPLRRVTGQFVVEVLVVARDEGDIAWQSAEPVSNAARSCGFDVSLFTISGASVSQRAYFSAAARDQRHSRVDRVECLCVVASGQGPAVQAASSAASGWRARDRVPVPAPVGGRRSGRDGTTARVPSPRSMRTFRMPRPAHWAMTVTGSGSSRPGARYR